ncbi:MAG: MBL fold metallo-hydrolase [Ardenticatenia bacterium]|nr:MBL fold metallo-hydrolase [Ardenticatenia bacterium]
MANEVHVAAIVLGITQDAGYPHVGCVRPCCWPAWRRAAARRHVACLGLVDVARGLCWLLDATPDMPSQLHYLVHLMPWAPLRLAGIFLTHAHIGHYTGLIYLGREAWGARNVPVYVTPCMKAFLMANEPWRQLAVDGHVELHEIVPGHPICLGKSLRITPLAVPHRAEHTETVGFLVTGENRRLLYAPDTDAWAHWSPPLEAVLEQVHVAFLDGTFFSQDELVGRDFSEIPHPPIVETLRRLRALPADVRARVRFIHFNHTNPVVHCPFFARRIVAPTGVRAAVEGELVLL